MSRNDLCFCGSGKKTKKCHIDVKTNSKLGEMILKYRDFDNKIIDKKITANCPINCSECCKDLFFVSENEFLLILYYLYRGGGEDLVNSYRIKAMEYAEFLEDNYSDILNDLNSFMPTAKIESFSGNSYFDDNYNWGREINCIFLEKGKCAIYEARPIICRMYGVCQTCEIINNKTDFDFVEARNLADTQLIIGDEILMKRPYPLFYYFYFFLNDDYYQLTMSKLTMIKNVSEKEYERFNKKFM